MEFKFENLAVGAEVVIVDSAGNRGPAKVVAIDPSLALGITVEHSEDSNLFWPGLAGKIYRFPKGAWSEFYYTGFYFSNRTGLQIVEIKETP